MADIPSYCRVLLRAFWTKTKPSTRERAKLKFRRLSVLCLLLGLSALTAQPAPASCAENCAIAGLDHMPLAVGDLAAATARYRALGFAIKPGRAHPNGIANNHIKFPDGSGIELLTAPAAVDALTQTYRTHLEGGDGPAFFSLHARDTGKLTEALRGNGFPYNDKDGPMVLEAPALGFLFFGRDNRSPTDRPEHFAHPNGATAMHQVWIAPDDPAQFRRLLTGLGGVERAETVRAPDPVRATVVTLTNGEIIILPRERRIVKDRPIIGAAFRVKNVEALEARFAAAGIAFTWSDPQESVLSVAPAQAHGLWLAFEESAEGVRELPSSP